MKFEPILNDLPLSWVEQYPQVFRNKAREEKWGSPVYFFPPTNKFNESGTSLYGYFYGRPYVSDEDPYWSKTDKYGNMPHYNNCVAWCGALYYLRTGIILKCVIGDAFKTYDKYDGRKDGGNFNNQYIGDTIQAGDMLVFADVGKDGKPNTKGAGHIVSVETKELNICEGGYSRKKVYRNKACITYQLKKEDMYTGKVITLRPQSPYKEILYGVIHTGDVFTDWEMPQEAQKDTSKNQLYVGDIVLNIRDEATTNSRIMGKFNKPKAYYDVLGIVEKEDYTWYHLGEDSWCAGTDGTKYYPSKNVDYKKLYEQDEQKIVEIKENANNILEVINGN